MRTKLVSLTAVLIGLGAVGLVARASLAGIWQMPLDLPWNIDPEFLYGSSYGGALHLGEDVEAPVDTPVYAAANGVVKFTGNFLAYHDWGGLILIESKNVTGSTVVSLYGHLDARTFGVVPGQAVNRGQYLGKIADKSRNGQWKPHLHFGIRHGNYQSSPWVYWGFGNSETLSRWEPASVYVPARANMVEVARIPITSRDRYETAAAVSSWQFTAPASTTDVFMVSGERFEDALSAAPLAGERRSPILLSRADAVPQATMRELERVLAAGGTVTLVGGEAALSNNVANQLAARSAALGANWTVERIAGQTAPATSAAVAAQLSSPTKAFVVSSRAFADGLSSGAPAATYGAPVLLTDPRAVGSGSQIGQIGLSAEIADYLEATPTITEVYIVGGTAVVAQSVEDELTALPQQLRVMRIAGPDRYATNRFMAEQFFNAPQTLVFATGEKFADALVGAGLAASGEGTLILAAPDALRAQVRDYIAAVRPHVHLGLVLGGTRALGQAVDLQVGALLNAGFVGASVPERPTVPPTDWTSAPIATRDGITVPVPSGLHLEPLTIGNTPSLALRIHTDEPANASEPEAVLATRLPFVADREGQKKAAAAWLGLAPEQLVRVSYASDRYSVISGFTPRLLHVIPRASELLVFAVPQSAQADTLLDRFVQLNTDYASPD